MVHTSTERARPTKWPGVDTLADQFLDSIGWRKDDSGGQEVDRRANPPWESWELNKEFFRALSQWTLDNPETSLDKVLDNMYSGLENSKEFIELIPDSPFPARGLVTALAKLFELGMTISRAKKEVQEFSKEVIRWVGQVKSAFNSPEDGRFTRQAWRNLKGMRDLVNEICLWAVERLEDGRWERITHGLLIQKEIEEFRKRIADARALFQDLALVSQAKGLDRLIADFKSLNQKQTIIMSEIQKVRIAQKDQHDEIMDQFETQKQTAERDRFFAETLNVHAIANPTYDSQGKRPCDEDTREDVLEDIRKWTKDISPGSPNFLWLTGDPGCGKSAVTASLARECKEQGVLWAQFFINRNNADTTNPRSYFPSIARQLANYSTEVAKIIQQTLKERRSLTDDISADQAANLFFKSIRKASELDPDRPVVIVIDGLDETNRDRLEETAGIFATLFTKLESSSNVKVFISSRTEDQILKSFARTLYEKHVKHVHLDTSLPSSIEDVSKYINRGLMRIVEKHNLNWEVWPGEKRSQILGERAGGLFIWAVTAVKFIGERLEIGGKEGLNHVLDLLTADVLGDINALYTLILKVTHGTLPSPWELERSRRMFGAIIMLQEPLCIDDLAALLDLRKMPGTGDQVDIIRFVSRFRTILVAGTETIDGKTIPRIHKSVYEFITSDSIDVQFRVDPNHIHLELAMQCLAQLSATKESITKNELSVPFRYASRFWSSHLSQSAAKGPTSILADYRYSQSQPLLSLPFNSILSGGKPARIQSFASRSQITTMMGRDEKIFDAIEGVVINHTDEVSCLAFSPDGKEIVSCSVDRTIKIWNSSNGEWLRTFDKHSSPFYAVAVSPDNKYVASGSGDGLVCLWNYSTGKLRETPPRRHLKPVRCVAFSPDGDRIISGSDDTTCVLWNVYTGLPIGPSWTEHPNPIKSIAFSANGRRVCSLDDGGHAIIWDVSMGRGTTSWNYNKGEPRCISFSPQNDDVVATSGRGGVDIRTKSLQWSLPDSDAAPCMTFSPDGRQIIIGNSNTISVVLIGANKQTTDMLRKGGYRLPGFETARSFALSPMFDCFVRADKAVHVYALEHDKTSLSVVPVNRLLPASAGNDGTQALRDVLQDLKGTQGSYNNLRLDGIMWYKKDGDIAESTVKLWVVRDDAIIAANKDGSVSVWQNGAANQTQE